MKLIIFLVLIWPLSTSGAPVSDLTEFVYPERLHPRRHRRDLSTKVREGVHEDEVSYQIKGKSQDLILDLKKADKVHTGSILLRTYDEEGNPIHRRHVPDDCHYTGSIRGSENSYAYISTCNGLTGSIDAGETQLDIEPRGPNGLHALFEVEEDLNRIHDLLKKQEDRIHASPHYHNESQLEEDNEKRDLSKLYKFHLANVEPQYVKYLPTTRTRYVEMFVAADEGMYSRYNKDENLIMERVLNAYGHVDKSYQAINVRIVIVAIDIWNNGPRFNRSKRGGHDLGNFRRYVNREIKKTSEFKDIRIDNSQFLSHYRWGALGGTAYAGGLCMLWHSSGVLAWSFNSIRGPYVKIGHELGHNFNFAHDKGDCKCLAPNNKGCFMGGKKSTSLGFSDCSMERYKAKKFACLDDLPETTVHSICGNGILEPREECDCGTPESCERSGDNCCQPHVCKLKTHVQCSHVNNPGCCNKQCYFRKEGTLCREPNGECDVPEYCTGESATCPSDLTIYNGRPCFDSPKMLIGPMVKKGTSEEVFDPPIVARYVKIIPKQWRKDGYACMKVDMEGCSKNKGAKVLPTALRTKSSRRLCISPVTENCDISDGTKLKFTVAKFDDCNIESNMFTHNIDGSMVHTCSNKYICKDDSSDYLILTTSCSANPSKFERTKEMSLKLVGEDLCWNGKTKIPREDDTIRLTKGCVDEKNGAKISFMTQDCNINLGFANMKLPDSSFTATSFKKVDEKPSSGRFGKEGWCPKTKTGPDSWMVDMLEEYKVKTLRMQGTKYNRIHGYHLEYSVDGIVWYQFHGNGENDQGSSNSYCFEGTCTKTFNHQCQELWNSDAVKASDSCWENLNTKPSAYGTCSPTSSVTCSKDNMLCGQLQCTTKAEEPYYYDYGTAYKSLDNNGERCSGAVITDSEQAGLGMVVDGTKCGDGKMCYNQECKTISAHDFPKCPIIDGKTCNGKGTCKSDGVCDCEGSLSPDDGCVSIRAPINGKFGEWFKDGECSRPCGGGKEFFYRFCNQPTPKFGGADCIGPLVEERTCNEDPCPVLHSCQELKHYVVKNNLPLVNGLYMVSPKHDLTLNAYCDMTKFGGGWTLIVASDSNTWTKDNLLLRNVNDPNLMKDYSLLKYADLFKSNYRNGNPYFEYRLEANDHGTWGGIWSAPNRYSLSSHSPSQTEVQLLQQFNDMLNTRQWSVGEATIDNRVPYIFEHRLTTNIKPNGKKVWGTITDNVPGLHPSRWISGKLLLDKPEHIWYWIREADFVYPVSCLEIKYRGNRDNVEYKNGVYKIEPVKGTIAQTYCDFERHGGGWTLLVKSSSQDGWTVENAGNRNSNDATSSDFSIFSSVDQLKMQDLAEVSFDYMIETDTDEIGGIFSCSVAYSSQPDNGKSEKPKLLKKFGNWNPKEESIAKYCPYLTNVNGVLLKAGSLDPNDELGAIIKTKESTAKYMKSLSNPKVIKIWMREGGSRGSCNDIKIHGYHKGKTDYKNGFYMLQNFQSVYCDMETTEKEGWTLIVTSVSSGWTAEEVLSHNKNKPSLYENYSILNQANDIKKLSNGKHFKYMLDAFRRGQYGGIYQAPIQYSFVSKEDRRKTTRLQKLGDWSDVWWKGVNSRMPYLGRPENKRALLTTATSDKNRESGTICADNGNSYNPAYWVNTKKSPGRIWYWMNENDCSEDYKPINGIIEPWSSWSMCSEYCGSGKRTRRRLCIPHKCGGIPCDQNEKLVEEENCSGPCKISKITDPSNEYCFEPSEGGCNVGDETPIVLRSTTTHCQDEVSNFVYNPDKGTLYHMCSKKQLCVQTFGEDEQLVVKSNCPKSEFSWGFLRTIWGSIQYGNSKYLRPEKGKLEDNVNIVLHKSYDGPSSKFSIQGADPPKVIGEWYKDITPPDFSVLFDNPLFKQNDPVTKGMLDNMISPSEFGSRYGFRMAAYFEAPMTGKYVFVAACNDICRVYFNHGPKVLEREKYKIIEVTQAAKRFQFDKDSMQKSEEILLENGKKYFLEGIYIEGIRDDHMEIGVYLPDGSAVLPITAHYLSSSAI